MGEPSGEYEAGAMPLILTAEQFDSLWERESRLRDQVAGATTISLEQLQKGSRHGVFDVRAWEPYMRGLGRSVHCVLADDVYNKIFNRDAHSLGEDPKEWIQENRRMGLHWAAVELARKLFNERPGGERMNELTRLYATALAVSAPGTTQEEMLHRISSHLSSEPGLAGYCRSRRVTPASMTAAIIASGYPEGVQVLYRKGSSDAFASFLQRLRPTPVDDRGAVVSKDLPAQHILAIIPLGRAEREFFGFHPGR